MYLLNLNDCETVLLLDLITQCLSSMDINPVTGKHELPLFINIDLRELELKVFNSIKTKLDPYLG